MKKKDLKNDKINEIADEYLKTAMLKHQQQIKIAEKINKATILDKSTKTLKSQLIDNMDDDEEDEYEEEEDDSNDLLQTILKPFLNKIAGGVLSSSPSSSLDGAVPAPSNIKEIAHNLVDITPEEKLLELKEKFLRF